METVFTFVFRTFALLALLLPNFEPSRALAESSAAPPASSRADTPDTADTVDIDAIPEVPPIAGVTYAGRPVKLVHDDLTVTLDRQPSSDPRLCWASHPTCKIVVATARQGIRQVLTIPGEEVEDTEIDVADARVELRQLDPAARQPAVVFSVYGGGAHCCYLTKIAVPASYDSWKVIDGGALDGEPFSYLDLLNTSDTELVHKDDRFDYAFGCYACSNAPTVIWRLVGGDLVEVSSNASFRSYQMAVLRRMEQLQAVHPDPQRNAYLAGWVAQRATVGQLPYAWSIMRARYDRIGAEDLYVCSFAAPAGACPPLSEAKADFPTALAVFLVRNGYMSRAESAQLGYDIAHIEARIQAQATAWYVYLRTDECAPATTPASPADLVSFDRRNGLTDTVEVLRAGADGKPIVVEVAKPQAGNLEAVTTFFRGAIACDDYRQQQQQNLRDLQ